MAQLIYDDFKEGLWLPVNLKVYGSPTSLLQAKNVEYFVAGDGKIKMRGRRAINRINTAPIQDPSAPDYVYALYRHYRRNGTEYLLGIYKDGATATLKHDSNDDGAFESIASVTSTVTLSGTRFYFATWPSQDKTFFTSNNTLDGLKYYDPGSAPAVATQAISGVAVDGPYLTVWKDRLWVTKASEINYSVYASEINDPATFTGTTQLSVNDPEGGLITGLVAYGDSLLIFKNTGVWRFTGDPEFGDAQLVQYCPIGCVAPDTIDIIPGMGIIYLSQYGLRLTDGQDPEGISLSSAVESLFITPTTQTTYSTSFGKYFPRKKKYYLFLNTATTGVAPTPYTLTFLSTNPTGKVDKYIWAQESWLQSQANTTNSTTLIYCLANEPSEGDNGDFFAGDDDGKVWEVDTGSLDTDLTTTYSVFPKVQTHFLPMDAEGGGQRLSRISRVYVEYRGQYALACELRYDQDYSDQAIFTLGESPLAYKYIQGWYSVYQHGQKGRTASLVITLPSDASETELNKIIMHVIHRGVKARINVVA